jgi:hypothetical protein
MYDKQNKRFMNQVTIKKLFKTVRSETFMADKVDNIISVGNIARGDFFNYSKEDEIVSEIVVHPFVLQQSPSDCHAVNSLHL